MFRILSLCVKPGFLAHGDYLPWYLKLWPRLIQPSTTRKVSTSITEKHKRSSSMRSLIQARLMGVSVRALQFLDLTCAKKKCSRLKSRILCKRRLCVRTELVLHRIALHIRISEKPHIQTCFVDVCHRFCTMFDSGFISHHTDFHTFIFRDIINIGCVWMAIFYKQCTYVKKK